MLSCRRLRAFCLAAVIGSAGCARTPVPELEPGDVPVDWLGPVDSDADVWPETDWWNSFDSPELTEIIDRVKAGNLDLATNARNLRSAQIALEEAGFELWPTPTLSLDTGASASRTRVDGVTTSFSDNGPVELVGSAVYSGILSKRANYDGAVADYDSRVALAASTALNTLGTASSTYFQLLLIRDRIVAARQNLENAEAIGRITEARVDAGVAVPIEALQQQIAIEQQRTALSGLIQDDLAARASLALLMGLRVEGFDVVGQTLQDIEVPSVQPGIPSELLVRRPDLVQAEASLRGAAASVDVVRASFLPQISLTGSASASSQALVDVVASPDTAIGLTGVLAQTLLDNGRRRRNVEQARLALETALASYREAVILAFNDIEVELSNIELLAAQSEVSRRNLEAAEEAFRIAELRYQEGVADYQTVLTSQNTLFSSRNAFLDNKLQQLNAIVAFYQALGGGWEREAGL